MNNILRETDKYLLDLMTQLNYLIIIGRILSGNIFLFLDSFFLEKTNYN